MTRGIAGRGLTRTHVIVETRLDLQKYSYALYIRQRHLEIVGYQLTLLADMSWRSCMMPPAQQH
jgi:hypothetical protein